jgi:FdhD protein
LSGFRNHSVIVLDPDRISAASDVRLIMEEPLSIRVQGKPYAVVMRTPGDELSHAAGFCLGEGVLDAPEDMETLAVCESNVVTVTLKPERRETMGWILERRGFVSQSSCGICGKELIQDLFQIVKPLEDATRIDAQTALSLLDSLHGYQSLHRQTRASHAAALFDTQGRMLSLGEDVGRHNALDKAIGKLFLEGKLGRASMVALSSRVSYELVQKAARARIPVILAISRPTTLAVEMAVRLNLTLACLSPADGLYVFAGEHRFAGGVSLSSNNS